MRRKLWCCAITMSPSRLNPNAEPFYFFPNPNHPTRDRSFSQSPQWQRAPRPRPPDHRNWIPARSPPPPPRCERFKVLSYNILADYLARDHRSKLYFHVPRHVLDWEWRKRRILFEFGLWSADILCLQEVDRFSDLQEVLAVQGYQGVWKMRTGAAIDGCAIFWRAKRFHLRHEEHIEFNKLGLRDNVAQICVLESRGQPSLESNSAASRRLVVVCNVHVLYNPKRGDVKLGQVRVLINQALSVSRLWNDAPVIVCGDFNSTPKSPLYNFILEKKLDLSGLSRDQISGQYSCVLAQTCHGDDFRRVNLPRANCVKSGLVGPGNSNAVNPNEHKASGETGFDLEAITSVKQVVDDIFHLHQSGAERKVTKDNTIADAGGTSNDYNLRDRKEILCHASTVSEFCVTNEVISGETSESPVGVQKLSESVGSNIKRGLKQNVEISTSDLILSIEKEESFDFFSDILSCRASDSIANMLNQKLDSPSSDAKASLHIEKGISKIHIGVDASSKAGNDRGSSNILPDEINYSNKNHGCPAEDSPSSKGTLNIEKGISEVHIGVDASTKACNDRGGSNILQDEINYSNKSHGCPAEDYCVSEQDPEEHCWSGDWSSTICSDDNTLDGENIFGSCQVEDFDPNFLVELHGKKSIDELTGDLMSSNNKSQIPYHSISGVGNHIYDPSQWTSAEIEIASGNVECSLLHHGLDLKSAYAEVKDFSGTKDANGEPLVTSYNRQFMGTVDYIWFSEGLLTVKVLDTIPKDVLRQTPGFPTPKWGSDHLAIACEFAFLETPDQGIWFCK